MAAHRNFPGPNSLRPHPYTMAQEGQGIREDRRCRHQTEETENCQRTPTPEPGRKGRVGGTQPAEGARQLLGQCPHSPAHTNRAPDSLNNVDRPTPPPSWGVSLPRGALHRGIGPFAWSSLLPPIKKGPSGAEHAITKQGKPKTTRGPPTPHPGRKGGVEGRGRRCRRLGNCPSKTLHCPLHTNRTLDTCYFFLWR